MRTVLPALLGLLLAGCTAETFSPAVPARFEVVQGGAQHGALGLPLDSQVIVRVVDRDGGPIAGAPAHWTAVGGGRLASADTISDAQGLLRASWVLGLKPEDQQLHLSALDLPSLTIGVDAASLGLSHLATGTDFGCGIDPAGATWCWGDNWSGTLGIADTDWSPVPRRIGTDTLELTAIVTGYYHACGLTGAGGVRCWGADENGQLGDGAHGPFGIGSGTPVTPTGLPPVVAVVAHELGSCGLTAAGSLWCWGRAAGGVPGSLPAPVFPADTFSQVALGTGFGCGITGAGTVQCWGDNQFGQLGRGTIGGSFPLPAPIELGIPAISVSAGDMGACAITVEHTLYCWGDVAGITGHGFGDVAAGTPSITDSDRPVTRVDLGWYCGTIWHGATVRRQLCGGWTTDVEAFDQVSDVQFGSESVCFRVGIAATYCKSYSDYIGPPPFGLAGTAIPAP